jgi:glutathione S-transferase
MISIQPEVLLKKALQHQDIPAGQILGEKAIKVAEFSTIFTDLAKYQKVLEHVESILDEVENELGSDNHLGPWLCGPIFSAADICLVSYTFHIDVLIIWLLVFGKWVVCQLCFG